MRNLILILFVSLTLTGCQYFVFDSSDLTLSGKYVVNRLEITNVDQATTKDSIYRLGDTYLAKGYLPHPFDSIRINRFYLHFDYSTIRMNLLTTTPDGRDIWEYGNAPYEIFYRIIGNYAFSHGYIQFTYINRYKQASNMTFLIEEDGFETLQLRSSGAWFNGKEGQKQVMTLYLTRVGP